MSNFKPQLEEITLKYAKKICDTLYLIQDNKNINMIQKYLLDCSYEIIGIVRR